MCYHGEHSQNWESQLTETKQTRASIETWRNKMRGKRKEVFTPHKFNIKVRVYLWGAQAAQRSSWWTSTHTDTQTHSHTPHIHAHTHADTAAHCKKCQHFSLQFHFNSLHGLFFFFLTQTNNISTFLTRSGLIIRILIWDKQFKFVSKWVIIMLV